MKQAFTDFRSFRNGLLLLLAMAVCAVAACAADSHPAPTTVAVKTDAASDIDAVGLTDAAMAEAMEGKFSEALAKLKLAREHLSADSAEGLRAGKAIRLIEDYQAVRRRMERERREEYNAAVARVRRALLVRDSLPALEKDGRIEKLRKIVEDGMAEFNNTATADSLETADSEQVEALRERSLKALRAAVEAVAKAEALLEGDDGPYAEAFRLCADAARKRVAEARDVWTGLKTETKRDRTEAAMLLERIEFALAEAMADVEAMASEKPWRTALVQARMAKRLAADEAAMQKEEWCKEVFAEGQRLGARFIEDGEWRDALSVYVGLKELDPDNEQYEEGLKRAQRHVRVLSLYGKQPEAESATRPASGADWREMARGIDADMVMRTVTQLNQAYVTSVDFHELVRGALRSVRVLAETPEAANSFPGLKDDKKRAEFIQAVEKIAEGMDRKDRVRHLQLQMALNMVLRASEKTVQIPVNVLAMEFTDGFLDELDKFSSMIWPDDVPNFRKQIRGQFSGVGIQITKEPGEPLRVVTPLPGTPAYRAGIKVGDLIIAVDGKGTEDRTVDDLVQQIMGEKGTKVVLTIQRAGLVKPLDVPVIRDNIRIETIKGWKRNVGDGGKGDWQFLLDPERKIGYIRLTQFTDSTHVDLVKALQKLRGAGVNSLVLDLRFDPGGLLNSATRIANEFLRAGRIVSTRGRQVRQTEADADPSGAYLDGDLVVLVNEASASAAEILSGAIKDWQRGLIVGQRSYGKGSVQNVIPVRDDTAYLKLTTAYYYLPTGRLLHRKNGSKVWGVDPDVEVLFTPSQMKRWLDIRRRTDILDEDAAPEDLDATMARQLDADIQLRTSVLLLELQRLRREAGVEVSKS